MKQNNIVKVRVIVSFITINILIKCALSTGEKSKEKCEEYSKFVYAEEDAPILLPGAATSNQVSQCGVVEVPLIVGGVLTGIKEFPHMAVIGFGDDPNISWMCGGTLISDLYILTASHCLKSKEKGPSNWVKLGDRTIDKEDSDGKVQQFKVSERIYHPNYKAPLRYHDIALIKLDSHVEFNGFVRPACLHTEFELPWKKAIATGFGKLSYESDGASKDLMKVQLSLIGSVSCNETFKMDVGSRTMPDGIVDSQLCAGEMEGGKDTCQGDSGGPLQQVLEKPYCMYSILGVTSFGKFCGFSNSPAVYTRVSHYVSWIEGLVWP